MHGRCASSQQLTKTLAGVVLRQLINARGGASVAVVTFACSSQEGGIEAVAIQAQHAHLKVLESEIPRDLKCPECPQDTTNGNFRIL